ncbi:MAG: biotin transporter BioY [Actinomycetota bacterium]|nr:biotin transporter BioY [Actinomycetota bacterium]
MNPNAATLRLAVWPRTGVVTDVLPVAAGAALVALAAQITIERWPVPITGQTFAVLLVGASLGAVRGLASLALYVSVGLLGAPVYQDRHHGLDYFLGATGGYLIGFVVAAALVGYLAERRWDRRLSSAVAAMLTGNVLIYAIGLPWLAAELDTGFKQTLEAGLYPFVVGDVLKLYLAGALLPSAWSVVERATGRRP